ncbi:hypothetical protein NBT05_17630 [Aquimarina sp. ERC-38]|uniref:hypothetical protein n=1 Tax=Aquimarina sp. ERC-38 TaxID=2949996 RepID=UPI00224720A7|nr:hypothetical protein [Aquimarina sp. ERC-38]UZO80745.1 hypothetical protein NBT05_17630 [Aquimarina sp. ERC-38]
MKKTLLCLTMSAFLTVISCGDDADNVDQDLENAALEDVALEASDVLSNLIIEGAEKKAGSAPAPTGTASFTIATKKQSAFQKNGFDIELQAPENYAGAYLVVKDESGVASGYFDIPKGANFRNKAKTSKKRNFLKSSIQKMDENTIEIDVDFNDVPPGQFCYLLCIYTEDGAVSEPSEICVEVEAWGGNSAIIGEWAFQKSTYNYDDENDIDEVGVEDCDERTVFCDNEEEIIVEKAYCDTTIFGDLTFKEDGTYIFVDQTKFKNLDYEATRENCEARYEEEGIENTTSIGNWAYNEEENILTLVEFTYIEDDEEETYTDGELLFNDSLKISGNSLEFFGSEEFEGELETFSSVFVKK